MGQDRNAHVAPEAVVAPPSQDEADRSSELLTVAEVAAMFRVSKMTVYRMVNSGELPAFKVGRSFRIRATLVQKLLSESSG
ncbi:MAG TPA: helix-turn-helix domain-containing protein [Mycobacterium sp.]|jgi:excisionase family DNA binding protein|uniref:helix-turn-helix domain-containing protein n=1 Tax=Mycobacterium sp. TaxID=1785 RepID=UPI002F40BA07